MKIPGLFFGWAAVLHPLSHYLIGKYGVVKGARGVVGGGLLVWAGLLLGISLTEAWVKFRSTIVERHVALDIGRRVFDALNTLELAVGTAVVGALFRMDPAQQEKVRTIPGILSAMLLLQALYLTPKLDLRAKFVCSDALAQKKHASKAEEDLYKEFKAATTMEVMPGPAFHHLYVVLEFVKFGLCLKGAEIALFQE